jgi:replicative DNA helicase
MNVTPDTLFNSDLERNILGGVMHDNNLLDGFIEFPLDTFYETRHQELFKIFKDFRNKQTNIDMVSLATYISKNKPKNLTVTYVADLTNSITTNSNFKTHLNLLQDYYYKRQLKDLIYKEIDFTNNADEIKDKMLTKLNEIYQDEKVEQDMIDYLADYLQKIYDPNVEVGVLTGYKKLDEQTRGFNKGELITIAAASGIGKTTLAMNTTLNQIRNGYKVSFFTLEVPKEEIINKFMANMCSLQFKAIRTKNLSELEKERIINALNFLSTKKFDIYEAKSNIEYICSQIRKDKLKTNIDIAYVDLINRVTSKEYKTNNRSEFIGYLTRRLKLLALELKIPIVITAQIIRTVEQRQDKRPELADLKESGSIAEDSDLVIGLYRNRKLEDKFVRDELSRSGKLNCSSKNPDENPDRIEVLLLKARYANAARYSMKWDADTQKITEVF